MSTSVYEDKNYADEMAAEQFSEEQVQAAMDALPDYHKYEVIATLAEGTYPSAVIVAFAKMADALGQPVTSSGYQMTVRRLKPEAVRRAQALQELRK